MNLITNSIIIYASLLIAIISIVYVFILNRKIKNITRGNGDSIEKTLQFIEKDLKELGTFKMDVKKYLISVENRLKKSLRGVQSVNFKAFEGLNSGGGQSFSIALLNEEGDGVIISTLHARDRVNVFSKPISNFKSELKLSDEEQAALTKAIDSCKL